MPRFLYVLVAAIFTFHLSASCQIDTAVGLVNAGKYGADVNAVASFLTFDLKGEKQKANAIYNWVTHNISYDVEALKTFPKYREDKAGHALKTHKAVCEGYSILFTELCRAAGLKSVTIEGYAKDWIFDNGDEMHIPRHQWSAVRINGKWELVDPTWGAGGLNQSPGWWRRMMNKIKHKQETVGKNLKFKFKYDTTYFMQDPEAFRLKHIPSDPFWQLTDTVMPLAVFEAGDSAIKAFNKLYSHPKQSDPKLDKICELDEKQKIYEFADRAYAYNNRYVAILALKNTYRAEAVVNKVITDTTVQSGDIMLKDALNNMKASLGYIKQQKKAFPEEYNKLKKKNKAKTLEAKQYIRQVKTDDKRLMAECNKRTKAIDNMYGRARKKLADAQKKKRELNPNKIDKVETSKVKKKTGSPELTAIKDSVAARNERLMTIRHTVQANGAAVRKAIVDSKPLLDSLVKSLTEEDSMLIREANARLGMHDSYDDEVKMWSDMFKQQKYKVTDTALKYYFTTFDSIVSKYKQLQNEQSVGFDLHKKNLIDLEKYKKWNNTDTNIRTDYAACVTDYAAYIDSTTVDYVVYMMYLKGNENLFQQLGKLSKRQIGIVEYMEKAEESRQVLEDRSIANKKAFDNKENDKQREGVQKGLKALEAVVKRLD